MNAGADTRLFLRAWFADPLRVASVIPSGQELAELITRDIHPALGPVLELGPGTGVFTQALMRRGVAQADLTLIELGDEFAELLAAKFPEARLVRRDAASLGTLPAGTLPKHGVAVSGLPLLSMSETKVADILTSAFAHLGPGAPLYQFTYGWRCPVRPHVLRELGLTASKTASTWRNVPPAAVYRISAETGVPASA